MGAYCTKAAVVLRVRIVPILSISTFPSFHLIWVLLSRFFAIIHFVVSLQELHTFQPIPRIICPGFWFICSTPNIEHFPIQYRISPNAMYILSTKSRWMESFLARGKSYLWNILHFPFYSNKITFFFDGNEIFLCPLETCFFRTTIE